jgi:toxin ParE1/3/4
MAGYDLTEQAVSDLREIARYTKREWGKEQARRYREELELSLQKLSLSPNIGRGREEIAPGVRSFRVAMHIAFYTQRRGGITILRLLHPSRDIEREFQKELGRDDERGR